MTDSGTAGGSTDPSGRPDPTAEDIVDALYHVLLRREPDLGGKAFWLDYLRRTGSVAEVCALFTQSEEYLRRPLSLHGPDDLLCKWQRFPDGSSAFIVLPVHSRDPIVDAYLRGEAANDYMLTLLAEMTSPGDGVLDLGCHLGTFSIGAAAMGRVVIAVDASPLHIGLVQRSKDLNHLDNLRLVQAAVSSRAGPIGFSDHGLFGAVDFSDNLTHAVAVASCRVDDLMADSIARPLRFIKMDIEGSEVDALVTGQHVLREDGPVVLFESNARTLLNAGHSVEALRRLFESLGYKVFRIENDRWVYAPPQQIQPEDWVDMLALNETHQQRWTARIDPVWSPLAILEKCRAWASLPYPNARDHLLSELRRHSVDASIKDEISTIERQLHIQASAAGPSA